MCSDQSRGDSQTLWDNETLVSWDEQRTDSRKSTSVSSVVPSQPTNRRFWFWSQFGGSDVEQLF